jgi:DNA-binding transcriptional MerR regulator
VNLAEVVEKSGIAGRTIRFYIARGILDGPLRHGRRARYTAEHLEQLKRIQTLQAEGRTLAEIGLAMRGGASEEVAPAATPWWQYAIAEDVVVWVRAQAGPWRMRQVHAAVEELARRLERKE